MPLTAFRALSAPAQVGVALLVGMVLFATAVSGVVWMVTTGVLGDRWPELVLLVTTVTGFVVNEWRQAKNRRIAKEDRADELKAQTEEIVAKARAEAEALGISTEAKAHALYLEALATARALREDQRQATETLAVAIENVHTVATEAATASKEAAHEANNANVKIADFQARLLSAEEAEQTKAAKAHDTSKKLDAIQDTADIIDGKVDKLKGHITPTKPT